MHMKPQYPLLNSLAILILIAFVIGAALAISGMAPALTTVADRTVGFFANLPPGALGMGLALISFLCGVVLSAVLIQRSLRNNYQSRLAQLQQERQQLEVLNEELHHQAASDGLLGMANRREFERVLTLEWRRSARERQPLTLLMVDVDCFKRYNDTYGHLAGDDCLQQVAAALKDAAARPGDLVARYGGEEMAILLPHTGLAGAMHMARRVHALLAERAIAFTASPVADHVTVSIGVSALLPAPNANPHTLIKQADDALYTAKESGRNRTESISRLRLIASQDSEAPPRARGA